METIERMAPMTTPTLESLIDSVCNVEGKANSYGINEVKVGYFSDPESVDWKRRYALTEGFKAGASCVASPLRAALELVISELSERVHRHECPHSEGMLIRLRRILSQAAEGESK